MAVSIQATANGISLRQFSCDYYYKRFENVKGKVEKKKKKKKKMQTRNFVFAISTPTDNFFSAAEFYADFLNGSRTSG